MREKNFEGSDYNILIIQLTTFSVYWGLQYLITFSGWFYGTLEVTYIVGAYDGVCQLNWRNQIFVLRLQFDILM